MFGLKKFEKIFDWNIYGNVYEIVDCCFDVGVGRNDAFRCSGYDDVHNIIMSRKLY